MAGRDHSFVVYVDETGDEGFQFPAEYGGEGSSLWFAVSAAVFKRDNEREQVKCVDAAKRCLKRDIRQPLHFAKLGHEQKVVYAREIGRANLRVVNVAFFKPNITERASFSERGRMYNYAAKMLLERVSWLCAERYSDRTKGCALSGDGSAKITFSQQAHVLSD